MRDGLRKRREIAMRKWKILMCLLLCSGAVFVPEYGSTKVYAEVKAADYLLPMQISAITQRMRSAICR